MRDRETIFSENERMANERLGYCTQCDESASLPKEKKCGRPVRGIKHLTKMVAKINKGQYTNN